MMLYLTGAPSSILNSEGALQDDPMKSLGGYISNSPVPNAALNVIFDLVSLRTLKEKLKETVAFGLINRFDYPVKDITAKIISNRDNICKFRIAAVAVNDKFCMEHINNRYSEPLSAEFYDATFYRAGVDVEILTPGIAEEEIVFDPFDVTAQVETPGIDGTYQSIEKAFSKSADYRVKRVSERIFRIESKDDKALESPEECSFLTTESANFRFLGKFENELNNEVYISETLQPGEAIGIWIQRDISEVTEKSEESMIDDYNKGVKIETLEEVELAINYNIVNEEPYEEIEDEENEETNNETE